MSQLNLDDRKKLKKILVSNPIFQSLQGRQMILEEADLGKIATTINLQDQTSIVVSQIITRLEKYGQLTYKNEALGFLLNYLKDDDENFGVEERDFFRHLINQYRLLTLDAKLPGVEEDTWKGGSTSEDVKEKVFGENTLRSIAFLEKALDVARSVVRIELPFSQGTGFMLTPDLLLTNHHVLENESDVSKAMFQFNYQQDFQGKEQALDEFEAKKEGVYHSNQDLDYAIVELANSPGNKWGICNYNLEKFLKIKE